MLKKTTRPDNYFIMPPKKTRGLKNLNFFWLLPILFLIIISGCKKDNYKGAIQGVCPVVVSTDPMDKAIDVDVNKTISVTFNTAMRPSTINTATFTISQGANNVVGTISPTADPAVFNFTHTGELPSFVTFTGTISIGAKDTLGSALASPYIWTFTTMPKISASPNPIAGGTVGGTGEFAQGSLVTVNAIPNTGYAFTNWTNNGVIVSTSASYQFTMNGNVSLLANFIPITAGQFALNLSSNPLAGGTVMGSGAYTSGAVATAIASPFKGYVFTNWTDNGVVVSTSPSYQFILASNRNLVANFKVIPASQLSVILSSSPPAGGSTNGSGSYSAGTSVIVTATPNIGYTFTNWTNNGVVASTSATYTFPLAVNTALVANFAINNYTLIVSAVNGVVVKNPNQANYNFGSTVQLTATPNSGYTFTSWSGDASGSTNPLTVLINANKNITANFSPIVVQAPLFATFFGGFGGTAGMTNEGINTVINNGAIGSTAVATKITGFHDGLTADIYTETPLNVGLVTGGIYSAPPFPGTAPKFAIATQFLADATAFYISISPANKPGGTDPGAGELGGLTLAPGVYKSASGTFNITNGDLTLDAKGDPNATWIFQTAAGLTVGIAGPAGARNVKLINGALSQNVYWYVGSAATINAAGGGTMVGTIIATSGVTFSTSGNTVQTVLNGRAISLVASVTMVNTTVNIP